MSEWKGPSVGGANGLKKAGVRGRVGYDRDDDGYRGMEERRWNTLQAHATMGGFKQGETEQTLGCSHHPPHIRHGRARARAAHHRADLCPTAPLPARLPETAGAL